jgi:glycosyltransferase involved in cell wall biosynthesis
MLTRCFLKYIIIDGASTDGTQDIINEHKDGKTVVVSEPNKGMYDAINKGLSI